MKHVVLLVFLIIITSTYNKIEVQATSLNITGPFEVFLGDDKKEKDHNGDIEVIKGGNTILIADYLIEGKITILDFYADWCGPCRALSPKLVKYAKANPNVALRKLDIVNWRSPLSKQMSKEYKLASIPFVLIFNEYGKLLGKVIGNDITSIKLIVSENQ